MTTVMEREQPTRERIKSYMFLSCKDHIHKIHILQSAVFCSFDDLKKNHISNCIICNYMYIYSVICIKTLPVFWTSCLGQLRNVKTPLPRMQTTLTNVICTRLPCNANFTFQLFRKTMYVLMLIKRNKFVSYGKNT